MRWLRVLPWCRFDEKGNKVPKRPKPFKDLLKMEEEIERDLAEIEAQLDDIPLPEGPEELFSELGRDFHHKTTRMCVAIARHRIREGDQTESWRMLADAKESLHRARNVRGASYVAQ